MDWNQVILNPWVGFVGTVFGVFGVLISIIFYFRTRQFQQPAYYKSSLRWYDGTNIPHNDIRLTFRGNEISRFTITHLVFWNAGNQAIRESDFAPASPLRLVLPEEAEIFDIRIIAVTASEIRASLDSPETIEAGAKKVIPVHFDYLDGNDGFCIQVIHDSKSAEGIEFAGKLPGVPKFRSSTSFSQKSFISQIVSDMQQMPSPSPLAKWVTIALAFFGLGGVGLWSLYSAFFSEFHWYQVFGAFMTIYLFVPFLLFSEINPPRILTDAFSENEHESLTSQSKGRAARWRF
jgi:hypothetical protein